MASVTAVFKALSNPNRQTVYQVICRAGGRRAKGITIEQICKQTGMKQPAVSHHVARLADAGLVDRRKSRWWVYCTAAPEGLGVLAQFTRNPATFPLE